MKKSPWLLMGFILILAQAASSQKIGLLTSMPQAPVHISSSGQVNTPGGLLVLGDTSAAHLELDFDLLQSKFDDVILPLRLQPEGGYLGINTPMPMAPLHVYSDGMDNTSSGLILLGDVDEGHLLLDYDLIQSRYAGNSFLTLKVQPDGGNMNMGNGLLFADRTNKYVGINTVSPTTELQLHGEMRMTTAGLATSKKDKLAIYGELEESGTVGLGWIKTDAPIGGLQSGNPESRSMVDVYEMYYKSQGAHRWFTNEVADVTSPTMVLTAEGDLGIGPDMPNGKLHLTNGNSLSLLNKGYLQMGLTNSTNLAMDANEVQARFNNGAGLLYLNYWGGNISMCDQDNGKVGIGMISPVAKLQVTDGVDASLSTHGYIVAGLTSGPNLVVDNNEIISRDNGAGASLFLQHDAGDLLLCGLENGQVGIGITSEANLPSLDYLLAVDGKIIAEEVRVELSQDWPDYVFDDTYPLTPISKLMEEVGTIGHLPGMPPASQVKQEGIELGDMQRRLLEKVEELTLYIFQLHEANLEMQKEIAALKVKTGNQ